MERPRLKIGVLTSTRADFGIYQPLLKELSQRKDQFGTELIVFGTHLSHFHGYTRTEIESATDFPIHEVFGMPLSDTPTAIANAYGTIVANFSQFWASHTFDVVFALGDRYEMSAAVQAGIPQGVKFAHLHGGETTLGAIDNIYRHQISLASNLHFVATETFADRVREITHSEQVHTVGALSLDNLKQLELPSWDQVKTTFDLPVDTFALCTFHPETVAHNQNVTYAEEAAKALDNLADEICIIITMPNADTNGTLFREAFQDLKAANPTRIFLIESFGRLNYFTAMQQARFLIGNTSSGIVEAASFQKYVVNVGNRQKGRPQSDNILNTEFDAQAIVSAATQALQQGAYTGDNIYYRPDTACNIINHFLSYGAL
jgi:GDP/UDP-N,N'-diacetylbacillosamine 2-epimerase (hydrolysing)